MLPITVAQEIRRDTRSALGHMEFLDFFKIELMFFALIFFVRVK